MKHIAISAVAAFAALLAIASCNKEVALTGVRITPGTVEMYTGDTQSLKVEFEPSGASGALTWSSTDPSRVSVSKDGLLTAKVASTEPVKIQAICGSIRSNVVEVYVTDRVYPLESISLSSTDVELQMGQTCDLTVSFKPENATNKDVVWSVSDPKLAEILADGAIATVTAIMAGEVDVVVKSVGNESITATCKVTIIPGYNPDGSVTLSPVQISSNAPMTYCTVLQDSSDRGLINGGGEWAYPWWQFKAATAKPGSPTIDDRKLFFGLAANLWDDDPDTFYATNSDIAVPNESYKYRLSTEWTGENLGADNYPDWDGQISEEGYPLSNGLTIPALVADHYIQVALLYPVKKFSLYLANSWGTLCFTDKDAVKVQLSEDGENFQTLSGAYKFDGATATGGGELTIENLTYEAGTEFAGKDINFIRLTHNGTTSIDHNFADLTCSKYSVDNSGWHIKGLVSKFTGNASPIAFAELKIWDDR